MADEALIRQIDLRRVHQREHLGLGIRVVDDRLAGQFDDGGAGGAGIDNHRNAGVDAHQIGRQTEVAQTGIAVGMNVDQPRGNQMAADIAHLRSGVIGSSVGADFYDGAVAHHNISYRIQT